MHTVVMGSYKQQCTIRFNDENERKKQTERQDKKKSFIKVNKFNERYERKLKSHTQYTHYSSIFVTCVLGSEKLFNFFGATFAKQTRMNFD